MVKTFYNILLNCEIYQKKDRDSKIAFLIKYLQLSRSKADTIDIKLVDYFDKYQAFCFDLRPDSVLRGDLNFDTSFDILDIVIIVDRILINNYNNQIDYWIADLNHDNLTNIFDVILLIEKILING